MVREGGRGRRATGGRGESGRGSGGGRWMIGLGGLKWR